MDNFLSLVLSLVLPLAGGIALVIIGIYYLPRVKRTTANGIIAEGIIFDFAQEKEPGIWQNDASSDILNKGTPIIRFVTNKQEWITEKWTMAGGLINFQTSLWKQGDKVKVIYNPDNPRDFVLAGEKEFSWIAYLVILAGAALTVYGLYSLVVYLNS